MEAPGAAPQAEPADANGTELLQARGLKVHFGGVRAVDGVDLVVTKGEILGLIGPNGAARPRSSTRFQASRSRPPGRF